MKIKRLVLVVFAALAKLKLLCLVDDSENSSNGLAHHAAVSSYRKKAENAHSSRSLNTGKTMHTSTMTTANRVVVKHGKRLVIDSA